ncbi:MAG TPA: MlaD family protein [Bryobacteraceae bacterium]|jgi:phospholipid/cholesterol/gamma-HCH transport system substrate-binding protein|nr:MlaD family protein [Bryobacteraceae bacterium]
MASKEKVSWAKFRVGILGIVSLFCVTLLLFLLTGSTDWFSKKLPLHVYLSDAAGLQAGAPVRINGIPAGKVDKVALSGETNPNRVIKVDFDVNENMIRQIPSDSQASVGSDNLLGSTKFLDITKGTQSSPIQPNSTIKAENTAQFDQLVKQGFGVLDSAQAILTKIDDVVGNVQNGNGTIGKLLVDPTLYNSLQNTVTQVQLLASTLNTKTGTIGRLVNDDTIYKQVEGLVTRLDTLTQGIEQGQGTAGLLIKDRKLYDNLDHAINQLNTMLGNLNAGKGTIGQLLVDDKIAKQVSGTLSKIDVTLDTVNSGQGTIGQLLVNPELYQNANATTRELHEVLRDFRANPKKFLSIRLHIF